MAHMLEKLEDGSYSMAWAGETPWHNLGKQVPSDLTPEQIMKAANLDWEVEKVPAYANVKVGNKTTKVAVGKSALVRKTDGRVLDVVGDDWNPLQNSEAFEFFNDFIAQGDMKMETAGSIQDGKRVFALARVNESFEAVKGDKVDSYLLLSNPHMYGKTIDVQFTPIRVVCWNTLSMALNSSTKSRVSVSHRVRFDGDTVKEMLGIAKDKLQTYKEAAQFLSTKRLKDETAKEYFARLWPKTTSDKATKVAQKAGKVAIDIENEMSRNANIAFDILQQQPGAKFAEGSFWQAFNASTFMVDHVLGRNDDNRMSSAWFGWGRNLKADALQLAMEMAANAPDMRRAKVAA